MKISVFRHSGFLKNAFGVNIPFAIYFNGEQIGSVNKNETKVLDIPGAGGILHVGDDRQMPWRKDKATLTECITTSKGIQVLADNEGQRFECGTNWWVAFDLLLKYTKALSRNVYFLSPLSGKYVK